MFEAVVALADQVRAVELRASGRSGPAGPALVVAGALILSSVFFPRPDDPADHERFLALLVEHSVRTKVVLMTVPIGIWVLVIALAALRELSFGAAAAALARYGLYGALCGAAVATIQFALAAGAIVEGADGQLGLNLLAASVYIRSFSLLLLWLALGAIGLSILLGRALPSWTGLGLLFLSAAMVAATGVNIFAGLTATGAALTGGLAALTAVWLILVGLQAWRRSPPG